MTGCQFLIPTQKQNVYSAAVLSSTLVNIVLNTIFIPTFLANGAAVASVIAESVGCLVMLVYVQMRKYVDVKKVFLISIKKWVAGILMLVCIKVSGKILGVSVKDLVLMIIEGGVVYFATLLIVKDDFFCTNVNVIEKKFKGMLNLKK